MLRTRVVVITALTIALAVTACPRKTATDGEGEGEGDVAEGEGEGEGDGGEGEGDAGEGEGEGDAGEGEGEGEGDTGTVPNGDLCDNDGDCASGSCGFFDNAGILESRCAAPGAGASTGSPCDDGTQCDHGLCLSGLCSEPCQRQSDCSAAQLCAAASVTVPGVGGGTLDVCVKNNNLPATPCTRDADCAATGRVCNTLVNGAGGNLALECGVPAAGGGLGAACTDGVQNTDECATGLCDASDPGEAGVCIQACGSDADCGVGTGFRCTGSGFSNIPARMCADACAREQDCTTAGRSCQVRRDAVDDVVDTICAPDIGASPPGAATTNPATCQTGYSLTQTVGATSTTFCTAVCGVDADCATLTSNALTKCIQIDEDTPSGGTQPIHVCGN